MTEKLVIVKEPDVMGYFEEICTLRKNFFKEYPYLQDIPDEDNQRIVKSMLSLDGILMMLALDGKKIAVAAVSVPFIGHKPTEHLQKPYNKFFSISNTKPEDFIYGIWTLSKPEYRNKGINAALGNKHNEVVKNKGYKGRLADNLIRPINDPRAPEGYSAASKFWLEKRGYQKIPVRPTSAYWTDIGDTVETEHLFEHYCRWV